jgi:hypothetical protein
VNDRIYRVRVQGGGRFLYDTVDVGRFALRMAQVGDQRPFTVKLARLLWVDQLRDQLADRWWRLRHRDP